MSVEHIMLSLLGRANVRALSEEMEARGFGCSMPIRRMFGLPGNGPAIWFWIMVVDNPIMRGDDRSASLVRLDLGSVNLFAHHSALTTVALMKTTGELTIEEVHLVEDIVARNIFVHDSTPNPNEARWKARFEPSVGGTP